MIISIQFLLKKQIEKEYGCKIEDKFKKVYEEPVGSASLSQVHKAILKNGDIVAIKVKRKDVTKRMEKDIKQIRKFVHRFGKIIKITNYLASDAVLEIFLSWIQDETDFEKEKNNILCYYHFANSVNGKILNTKKIVVPKVYKKLCTKNIIVMEFVFSKTINQIRLTNQNKERIRNSLNDYVALSFYALFHDIPVIFHGDPHGGNIYIDKEGNVGFLDMGLIFELTKEEAKYVRDLFLYAYTCNVKSLVPLLLKGSEQKDVDMHSLEDEIMKCCKNFKSVGVPEFFMNMVFIFTNYNITVNPIFYKMLKAFVALFGMNTFLENMESTEALLFEQIVDFYVSRATSDIKEIMEEGIAFLPKFIKNTMEKGFNKSITEQIVSLRDLNHKVNESVHHFDEVLSFF